MSEELKAILSLADAGTTAILILILGRLWTSYEKQNSFIQGMLLQGQAERAVLAERLNMSPELLEALAIIRRNAITEASAGKGDISGQK
jgi:hypothetical protein